MLLLDCWCFVGIVVCIGVVVFACDVWLCFDLLLLCVRALDFVVQCLCARYVCARAG